MPIPLSQALAETYSGWQEYFPSAWGEFAEGVELSDASVDSELELDPWVPIFPPLRREQRVLGAPKQSQVFRAFDEIRPSDVKVVIVGQDPYPDVAKATGLSFEQGGLKDWLEDRKDVSKSLKNILRAAAATEGDADRYLGNGGWANLIRDIDEGLPARDPADFFEQTRNQGVLWLNTTLSISLFRGSGRHDHQAGHRDFWAPLVDRIVDGLASRPEPCVFVLWGGWARDLRPMLEAAAAKTESSGSLGIVETSHPVTTGFLRSDPLSQINRQLDELGLDELDWL